MSLPTLTPDNKKMMNEQLGNLGNAIISSTNNNSNQPENNTSRNTSSSTSNSSISTQNKSESKDSSQSDPDTKQIEIIGNDAKKLQDLTNKNENENKNKNNNNANKSKKNLPKNNNLTKKKNNNNKKNNEPPVDEPPVDEPAVDESPVDEEPMANEPMANEPSVDEGISKSTEENEEDKPDLENTTTNEITKDIGDITGENVNNTTKKELMASLNKLTMNLLNHQVVMKLFHFQTNLYGAHKASDTYGEKFAATMDKFLEIAQGIYGKVTLKKYSLTGSSHTDENILKHLDGIIILLRSKIDDILAEYTELINVRDELVGDAEQLKYLLTFK
jgi:hypothetical protein